MSQDPNQTTTFEAEVAGNKLAFSSKRMEVFIWIAVAIGLASIGVQLYYVQEQVKFLTFRVQDTNRSLRELTCLEYIPESERLAHVGQAAACRKMGEMQ